MSQLSLDAESCGGSRPQGSRAHLRSSGFSFHTQMVALKLESAHDGPHSEAPLQEETIWSLPFVFLLRLCAFCVKGLEHCAKMLFGIRGVKITAYSLQTSLRTT